MRFVKFGLIVSTGFLLMFISSCNSQGKKESSITNFNQVADSFSADIYCFCLMIVDSSNGSNEYASSCTSYSYLYYKDILKGHGESYHIVNRDTLTMLKNLIYSGKHLKNDYPYLGELNFAIIFRREDNRTDSFSFKPGNMNSLSINKDSAVNYGFNVLDSIAKIIGKKNMECLSPTGQQ